MDDERPWEEAEVIPCTGCGVGVRAGERGFVEPGAQEVLCWDCAIQRGGQYDAEREIWSIAPEVTDLAGRMHGEED